ncbi:hypothetical protein [Nonomuraea sp. NPDC003754]
MPQVAVGEDAARHGYQLAQPVQIRSSPARSAGSSASATFGSAR